MTEKYFSIFSAIRSSSPWGLCLVAIVALFNPARGADATAPTDADAVQTIASGTSNASSTASLFSQIQAIRTSSETPQEVVSRMEALLKARPRLTRASISPTAVSISTQNLSGDDKLRAEVINALGEIRASAQTPEEKVKLVEEFRRLNAQTLSSLAPDRPTAAQLAAGKQALVTRLQTQASARPGDIQLQAASVLAEMRQQAATPRELVAEMAEFSRLNRATIQAAEHQQADLTPLKSISQ